MEAKLQCFIPNRLEGATAGDSPRSCLAGTWL